MPQNKKHQLVEHIRSQVLTMTWAPGQDLDESSLSAEFGISRTPLREVFRDLAGQGFLSLRQHRTARVADLSHQTLREFFQTAPMIYAAVTRLAAENRTPAQIDQLAGIQGEFETALAQRDGLQATLLNHAFHHLIAEMAGNRYLMPSFDRLLIDHTRIGRSFFRAGSQDHAVEHASRHHHQMIVAIRDQDGARGAELALEHWQLSRQEFEKFVLPQGLDITLQGDAQDAI